MNSGIFCEGIIYVNKDKRPSNETKYGYGRVVEVPNKKKDRTSYVIEYDTLKHDAYDLKSFSRTIINGKETRELLKVAFARADKMEYRFVKQPKNTKKSLRK